MLLDSCSSFNMDQCLTWHPPCCQYWITKYPTLDVCLIRQCCCINLSQEGSGIIWFVWLSTIVHCVRPWQVQDEELPDTAPGEARSPVLCPHQQQNTIQSGSRRQKVQLDEPLSDEFKYFASMFLPLKNWFCLLVNEESCQVKNSYPRPSDLCIKLAMRLSIKKNNSIKQSLYFLWVYWQNDDMGSFLLKY